MHYHSAKANLPEQKERRKALRNNSTPAESILWRVMKGKGISGWKFRRQQGIGPYILDFYCPELRLGVELDGNSHDYKYEYDEQRRSFLKQQGIPILRFSNEAVLNGLEGVIDEIQRVGFQLSEGLVTSEDY